MENEVESTEEVVAEEGATEQTAEQPAVEQNAGDKPEVKTFTQEQLNRMMAKEKGQGKASVYRELGIDPKDAKAIAMVKAIIGSQKTEEEKTAEVSIEAQGKMQEAEHRAAIAEAKVEAMMQGVKPECVDDAITLALAKVTEDADIKTIIGEFKTKYPVWFVSTEETADEKPAAKGTGSSVKAPGANNSGTGKEVNSLGARLAAQRKGTAKKSSYWGN